MARARAGGWAEDSPQARNSASLDFSGLSGGRLRKSDLLALSPQIHVRPRFVPDDLECIRVTPNVVTTAGEVDRFAAAIGAAARELR